MSESKSTPVAAQEIHRGVTFGFFAENGYYSSKQARLEVDRMAELGVTWVCVVTTVWQETFASTVQFRHFKRTPGDHELIGIIDYIHEKGMKVQLRPMLQGLDGSFRFNISFPWEDEIFLGKKLDYWTRWFDSLVERTLHYASIAELSGCEAYGLDSELDGTTGQDTHWKRVIAAARSVYSGHLTTGHTLWIDMLQELKERPGHWFRELDSLGTSFYPPLAADNGKLTGSRGENMYLKTKATNRIVRPEAPAPGCAPDSAEMKEWLDGPRRYFAEIAQELGKPFYLAECGCRSTSTALGCGGSVADLNGCYDGEAQAFFLDSILHAFWNEPWFMGIYWWKWDEHLERPHYANDPRGDQGLSVWNKPAAEVMKKWFTRPERRGIVLPDELDGAFLEHERFEPSHAGIEAPVANCR